jgi:integrase/recombinase XerC/integrase/recombinase XerD
LWRRGEVALRERALWRLLYETAARANEILSLDVDDLDLVNKRARIRSNSLMNNARDTQPGVAVSSPGLLHGVVGPRISAAC